CACTNLYLSVYFVYKNFTLDKSNMKLKKLPKIIFFDSIFPRMNKKRHIKYGFQITHHLNSYHPSRLKHIKIARWTIDFAKDVSPYDYQKYVMALKGCRKFLRSDLSDAIRSSPIKRATLF